MRGTWDRTRTFITQLFTPEFFTDGGTGQGTGSFFLHQRTRHDRSNGFQLNQLRQYLGPQVLQDVQRHAGSRPGVVRRRQGLSGERQGLGRVGRRRQQLEGRHHEEPVADDSCRGATVAVRQQVRCTSACRSSTARCAASRARASASTRSSATRFPTSASRYSNTITYKRLTLYGLLDGTIGQRIYNQAEGWGLLDFSSANFDHGQRRRSRPQSRSATSGAPARRRARGIGGFYDMLGPNNYNIEDASFAKLREVSLTYHVGPVRERGRLDRRRSSAATCSRSRTTPVSIRKSGAGGGYRHDERARQQVDAFGFPTLRTTRSLFPRASRSCPT